MKLIKKYTIMFVPFNQEKVIQFNISNLTIYILGGIFVLMLCFLILSFFSDENFMTLRTTYKNNSVMQGTLSYFDKKYQNNQKNYNQLQKEMEHFIYSFYPILNQRYYTRDSEQTLEDIDFLSSKMEEFASFHYALLQFFNNIPTIFPLVGGGRVTSGFGTRIDPFTMGLSFHPGVDIPKFPGSPIKAAASGKVVLAGWLSSYGFVVSINHNYGFNTTYAHQLSQPIVSEGQYVAQGQIIGYVGSTGRSVGYHLHYEIRNSGKLLNPVDFLFIK